MEVMSGLGGRALGGVVGAVFFGGGLRWGEGVVLMGVRGSWWASSLVGRGTTAGMVRTCSSSSVSELGARKRLVVLARRSSCSGVAVAGGVGWSLCVVRENVGVRQAEEEEREGRWVKMEGEGLVGGDGLYTDSRLESLGPMESLVDLRDLVEVRRRRVSVTDNGEGPGTGGSGEAGGRVGGGLSEAVERGREEGGPGLKGM
jgi:hypothetical protein